MLLLWYAPASKEYVYGPTPNDAVMVMVPSGAPAQLVAVDVEDPEILDPGVIVLITEPLQPKASVNTML